MYLEGVIICVGYADFLSHTLPLNKSQFNNLVVVTDTKDKDTKSLCEYYNVRCVQTDVFYENGDKFNKGKGINVGLETISKSGWVIHLDADIVLPPLTRTILENIELDSETLYGIDRMMCPTFEAWQNFMNRPKLHEGWVYVHANSFPIGVRIAEYMSKGYEPIGFFQLWNPIESGVFTYPDEHGEADRTDVLFAKKFRRLKRQLLPEIVAIHLDSEDLDMKDMGKNWNGRKTAPFTFNHAVTRKLNKEIPKHSPNSNIKKGYNLDLKIGTFIYFTIILLIAFILAFLL